MAKNWKNVDLVDTLSQKRPDRFFIFSTIVA